MFKITLTSLIALFISLSLSAQINESIKQTVINYPKSISNYEKLSKRINSDYKTDREKASAIYVWITHNIAYDVPAANANIKPKSYSYRTQEEKLEIEGKYNHKIITKLFKKNKAICDGYSRLFKTLCDLSDIECVIISGTSKTTTHDIGKLPKRSDHAWNAIKLDGKWELIDSTWGAGSVNAQTNKFTQDYDETYFCTAPELFFLKHFPDDEQWLLVKRNEKDFANLPLYYSSAINSNIQIIKPNNGVIEKVKGDAIQFTINCDTEISKLSYAFSKDKYSTKLKTKYNKGKTSFSIPIKNIKRGYLTLYHNNKAIVAYKINLK
ncbi:transglutaminase domain-containing protein [Saccharicrinis aurantiacus]|uniref:transglutaminase domain-containing protein n=1 Tax=Saccharicrinis aurantiacus TaxID=1849719 RepID=UPI002491E288|nr:transglutaminase domain-containing protein [Saccharicrinis aurantiacus]